jgi:hypothetical protein
MRDWVELQIRYLEQAGMRDTKLVRMEVGESGWPLLQGV